MIKLGKEQLLETEIYAKNIYNWMQMREIRLGLADRLDVSSYARLILSATDMQKERIRLFSKAYQENPKRFGRTVEIRERPITLRISDNYLKAFIKLSKKSYLGLDMESLLGEDPAPHNSLYSKTVSALEFKATQLKACEKEINRLTVVLRRAQKGSVRVHGDIQESVMFIINGSFLIRVRLS